MKKILSSIKLTESQVFGDQAGILTEVYPSYIYENGKRTNKRNGSRLTIVAPDRAYEKIGVRIETATDLTNDDIKASTIPIRVRFSEDFFGRIFWKDNGEPWISCTATDFTLAEEEG